jgi:predicted alpha/beta superfamily hydrolase
MLSVVFVLQPLPASSATDQTETKAGPIQDSSPAVLPGAKQFDITSKITGRTYRIYLSGPTSAPPASGYPVLYVLDAYPAFPTAATQAVLSGLSGHPPTVVVGIGYPNFAATMRLRDRDLTPFPADADALGGQPGTKPEDFGGGEDFHRFIAKMFSVDAHNQALMGYSLGGLFTLNVMFRHPDAYRTYIAGSPSIWYDRRKVLEGEAAFSDLVRAGKIAPRLLITSDEWEQSQDAPDLPATGDARAKALADMAAARMVDNAKELADRLRAIKGGPGYEVRYALFPRETHLTGIPASTSRGVAFLNAR